MSDNKSVFDPQLESINNNIRNQYVIIDEIKRKQRVLEMIFIAVLVLSLAIITLPYLLLFVTLQVIVLLKLYSDIVKVREMVAIEKGILIITQDLRHMFYDDTFRPDYLKSKPQMSLTANTESDSNKKSTQ